jgi:hypothetical protein
MNFLLSSRTVKQALPLTQTHKPLRTYFHHSSKMPSTMKAIVINPKHKDASLVRDRPLPKLRSDYILVKTVAVALVITILSIPRVSSAHRVI